jgi:hypothetical protein
MLFVVFDMAIGKVISRQYKRRRRMEFLDCMNRVVAAHPGSDRHVILGNLNSHKPKNDLWLNRHPYVNFHFTQIKASWLYRVRIWFLILETKALNGTSFSSRSDLMAYIDDFIAAYNIDAKPFVWTKSVVHKKGFKRSFADEWLGVLAARYEQEHPRATAQDRAPG